MSKKKLNKMVSGVKVSRKELKKVVREAQAELIDKIDDLDAQRSFAKRVLDLSNSIINLYSPIFDERGQIVDFVIEYSNNRMSEPAEKGVEKIVGQKMSEHYPINFENGVVEEMIQCFESSEKREFQKDFTSGGITRWFATRIVKMDEFILSFARDITKEKEYEIQLDIQNKLLKEAEYVGNSGSYKWNLHGEYIQYSDNAFRLFGYEPGEFDPTVEKFMSLVHPDDVADLIADYDNIMQRKERTEAVYRIITKGKKIKMIRSVGEFYKKDGGWYMVGVLSDVSRQMAVEGRLRTRNMELKRSNDELESFNRIASHDLQEPLRKIQMFVSRFEDDEGEGLSNRSKEYLIKIVSSSERMSELITNLLSYSKLDVIGARPEKIDLNEVLANVKDDLAQRIEESGAYIKADTLPKIMAIKFQMEQLFANLIGNSIKYSKSDRAPEIEISSALLSHKKIEKSFALPRSKYIKLEFKDNGIGFDPAHKEKIFEIFQRLHPKNKFSGTGLGLAICRKIVETHNGVIYADGAPDNGASFTIYLPYSV